MVEELPLGETAKQAIRRSWKSKEDIPRFFASIRQRISTEQERLEALLNVTATGAVEGKVVGTKEFGNYSDVRGGDDDVYILEGDFRGHLMRLSIYKRS